MFAEVEDETRFEIPGRSTLSELLPDGEPERIRNNDVYIGFPRVGAQSFPLIRDNVWLRRRNGEYEVKDVEMRKDGSTRSKEIRGAPDINAFLRQHFCMPGLPDVVRKAGSELAYVRTDRERYEGSVDIDGIRTYQVEVDDVNIIGSEENFRVGELEVNAASEERAAAAINTFTDTYGLEVVSERKIVRALRLTKPGVYDVLRDEGVAT